MPEKPKEKKEEDKGDFVVWEDNWETVLMFLRMQTQWATTMGGFAGLKYEVLLVSGGLFDLYNVHKRREMLEALQVMEAAALPELNKDANGK
jgi:hypothetical protein